MEIHWTKNKRSTITHLRNEDDVHADTLQRCKQFGCRTNHARQPTALQIEQRQGVDVGEAGDSVSRAPSAGGAHGRGPNASAGVSRGERVLYEDGDAQGCHGDHGFGVDHLGNDRDEYGGRLWGKEGGNYVTPTNQGICDIHI